jgi:hypothetical protein
MASSGIYRNKDNEVQKTISEDFASQFRVIIMAKLHVPAPITVCSAPTTHCPVVPEPDGQFEPIAVAPDTTVWTPVITRSNVVILGASAASSVSVKLLSKPLIEIGSGSSPGPWQCQEPMCSINPAHCPIRVPQFRSD